MLCFLLLVESSFSALSHFFSFQLTLYFGEMPICVSLLYKPPGYHTEDVRGSYGWLSLLYILYIILLYQTNLSDARGGSLTEKFGVARFIVIEHPCLSSQLGHISVSYCPIRWFLLKQATISYLCISRCWVCNDGGFGLFRFLKGTLFPYSLHHWYQTQRCAEGISLKEAFMF